MSVADISGTTGQRHSLRRLRSALVRRWWVVVLCAVLGSLLAFAVASKTPSKFTSESVVIVPALVPGQTPPGSPDAAIKLAKTYSTLIPLDDEIVAAAAAKARVSPAELRKNMSVSNDLGTALVRIDVIASTADSAVAQAAAVATIITKPSPPGQITSGSMRLVTVPDSATVSSETGKSSLAIGGLLGLIVGLIMLSALERSDKRIDTLEDLAAATGTGVSAWGTLTPFETRALAHRWRSLSGVSVPTVAFVGTGKVSKHDVESMLGELAIRAEEPGESVTSPSALRAVESGAPSRHAVDEPSGAKLLAAGRPGCGEGAELLAQTCDLVVLVVAPGSKQRHIAYAREQLAQYGAEVSWAMLAPRHVVAEHDFAPLPAALESQA